MANSRSDPNRAHFFVESRVNSACAVCAGQRKNPIHKQLPRYENH